MITDAQFFRTAAESAVTDALTLRDERDVLCCDCEYQRRCQMDWHKRTRDNCKLLMFLDEADATIGLLQSASVEARDVLASLEA